MKVTLPVPVQQIIKFYSGGRDVSINPSYTSKNTGIGGMSSNDEGWISLNPATVKALQSWNTSKPDSSALDALVTLIHESLHMRRDGSGWHTPNNWTAANYPALQGQLRPWDDEHQAAALSATLIPDALQRFFGIKSDSTLGQSYAEMAQDAVRYQYGADPKNPLGAPTQTWQDQLASIGQLGSGFNSGSLAPIAPLNLPADPRQRY